MSSWPLLLIGIFFLLAGIVMFVLAIIWKSRSTDQRWTGGMIALAIAGGVSFIFGIVLLIIFITRPAAHGAPVPTGTTPAARPPPDQEVARVIAAMAKFKAKQFSEPIIDPITGETTTRAKLREKCLDPEIPRDTVRNWMRNYGDYWIACSYDV